jgi:hypothetical protein
MKFCTTAVLFLLFIVPSATAFLPQQQQQQRWNVVLMSSRLFQQRKASLIEGNQLDPSEQQKQLMDEMITKLADAKPNELPDAVRRALRVISSPQFFLRIAERTDDAIDDDEKEKLAALASNLVSTLEVVVAAVETTGSVETTEEETLDDIVRAQK